MAMKRRKRRVTSGLLTLVIPLALLAGAASLVIRKPPPAQAAPVVTAPLSARAASEIGVFESRAPASYQQYRHFAEATGAQPSLDLYYSQWGTPFASQFAAKAYTHGATVVVQIDPYRVNLAEIGEGRFDDYLRAYAAQVRKFGHPVVIGFAHEMNGSWYPWGYGHATPATWVRAWRRVVTVFQQSGATNVTWLWTVSAYFPSRIAAYWPGAQYVSWVGFDGYYETPSDTFRTLFVPPLKAVRKFTSDPVLISETAVGPDTHQAAGKITGMFDGIRAHGMLGLIWFDRAQHQGIHHQDWRLEDSKSALDAFRAQVAARAPPAGLVGSDRDTP